MTVSLFFKRKADRVSRNVKETFEKRKLKPDINNQSLIWINQMKRLKGLKNIQLNSLIETLK